MDDPLVIARAEASTAAHQRDFFRKRLDDERTKAGALEVRTRYLEAQNEAIWEANLRLRQELARLRSRRRRQVVDVETDDDEGEGGAPPAGPRRP